MPVPRTGAGMCARRRSNFLLLRQKKVTKEKAPPSLRPLRFATGQTCVGAAAGCAVELASLLRSAARTATASQITKHGRSDAHAHPATAPTQAQPAGDSRTSKHPLGSSLRSTRQQLRPARGACAREVGPSAATARVDVCSPSPLYAPRSAAASGSGLAIV